MVEYGLTKWNWGREPGCSPGKVLIRYKRLRERYYLIRSTWMPPPLSTADDDDGAEGEEVGDDVATTTTTGENGDENETKWMNGRMDGRINGVVDGCFLFCSSFYRSAFAQRSFVRCRCCRPLRRHWRNYGMVRRDRWIDGWINIFRDSPCLWDSPLCGNLCTPCADNKFGSEKIIQNDITQNGTLRISISS